MAIQDIYVLSNDMNLLAAFREKIQAACSHLNRIWADAMTTIELEGIDSDMETVVVVYDRIAMKPIRAFRDEIAADRYINNELEEPSMYCVDEIPYITNGDWYLREERGEPTAWVIMRHDQPYAVTDNGKTAKRFEAKGYTIHPLYDEILYATIKFNADNGVWLVYRHSNESWIFGNIYETEDAAICAALDNSGYRVVHVKAMWEPTPRVTVPIYVIWNSDGVHGAFWNKDTAEKAMNRMSYTLYSRINMETFYINAPAITEDAYLTVGFGHGNTPDIAFIERPDILPSMVLWESIKIH